MPRRKASLVTRTHAPVRLQDGTLLIVASGGGGGGGSGDVVGPAVAVDDRIAVFDTTTGKLIADGGYTIAALLALIAGAPAAHAASHQNGGGDEISVAGLSGLLGDPQTALYDTVITITTTGAVNDWAPAGLSRNTLILWNGASAMSVTGLAGGSAGQRVTVKNITAAQVWTGAHASGSSAAGNRYTNLVTSAPTPVAAGGWITYQHDGTNWLLIGHVQGARITSTFSAGDYVPGAGVTSWTVEAGDIQSMGWLLEGNKLTVFAKVDTTSIVSAGGTHVEINKPAYGGYTIDTAATGFIAGYLYDNGNTPSQVNPQAAAIRVSRFDGATFTTATNLFYVRMIAQVIVT